MAANRGRTSPGWMRSLIDSGLAAQCGRAWLTYCVLRRHANPRDQMTACVDLGSVAAKAGCSIASVKRHLCTLDLVGLISKWHGAKRGGGRRLLVRILRDPKAHQRALETSSQSSSVSLGGQSSSVSLTYNEGDPEAKAHQRALRTTSPTETRTERTESVSPNGDGHGPPSNRKCAPPDAPDWAKGALAGTGQTEGDA